MEDDELVQLKLDEAVLAEIPALERGNGLIKLFAATSPLLGLLGTVTGMILTFQAISLFGTGDPKLMRGDFPGIDDHCLRPGCCHTLVVWSQCCSLLIEGHGPAAG